MKLNHPYPTTTNNNKIETELDSFSHIRENNNLVQASRRNLDQVQRQELIDLLHEQHFERLANKIKSLNQSSVSDCRQQIGKLLFEHCLARNRRHQLIQLIESKLVDINVRLDNYGRTLLHRSAYNLDVELVKILINYGVNIRLRDYAGNTALHIAIQSYRNGAVIFGNGPDVVQNLTSIIKLLLEADETRNIKRKEQASNFTLPNDVQQPLYNQVSVQYENESTYQCSRLSLTTKTNINIAAKLDCGSKESTNHLVGDQKGHDTSRQRDDLAERINPILLEDMSSPLVNTKNAFGRTALHYCVLVVGEQHLAHFVQLLISYGADIDATDTRMKTPLYCLVKRPGISAIRQKCLAITHLLNSGCDDLGLAIKPETYFSEDLLSNLEQDVSNILQPSSSDNQIDPIFTHNTFRRVPRLKHLTRLRLIKLQDEKSKLKRQSRVTLPSYSPDTLNLYINRRILDQSELF